jgi:hypothetical protein
VPAALRALAALHEQRGELPAALRALDRLVEIKPDSPSAQTALRRVRAKLAADGQPVTVHAASQPASNELPPLAGPLAGALDWSLTAGQRESLAERLTREPAGSRVYLRFDGRDAGARQLAQSLATTFTAAGWQVASLGEAEIPLRPGLHLFAAESPTPAYDATKEALERAGFSPSGGSQYQDFLSAKRRDDPSYRGLSFAAGQDFILAVGRRP